MLSREKGGRQKHSLIADRVSLFAILLTSAVKGVRKKGITVTALPSPDWISTNNIFYVSSHAQ